VSPQPTAVSAGAGTGDSHGEIAVAQLHPHRPGAQPYARFDAGLIAYHSWGSAVAYYDVLRAALRHHVAQSAYVFSQALTHAVSSSVSAGVRELCTEFGERRVTVTSVRDLPRVAARDPFVFISGLSGIPRLAQARDAIRGAAFPICATVHSIDEPTASMSYLSASLWAEEYDSLIVTSDAGAFAVRTLLDEAGEFLHGRIGRTVPRRLSIVTIPLGVDAERLQPVDRLASRRLLGLPADGTLILYLGRLTDAYKADLEPLLVAVSRIAATDSNLCLLIAGGEGGQRYPEKLIPLAAQLGIESRLRWFVDFPPALKPLIYGAADVFVSPSDNIQETFGLVILEAMAAGLPVVASDWSGYRDLVADGASGFLIPTAVHLPAGLRVSAIRAACDAASAEHYVAQRTIVDVDALTARLEQLAGRPELRRRFGDEGRRRVEQMFSWAAIMPQYRALWREQLARARCRRIDPRPTVSDINHVCASFATSFNGAAIARAAGARS
jgi:glycosyltransferase involved in cell wall biosynthesis